MGPGGAGRHYWGRYQFGSAATADTNRFLGENVSRQQFRGNQELAERHFDAYSLLNHQSLMRNSPRYRAMSATDRLAVLGYAHNQGAGGAANWLATGRVGSDAFGTAGTRYFQAILDGLRRIGQFIGNVVGGVVQAIGTAIGGLFNPQQQPASSRWVIGAGRDQPRTDQPYAPFSPPSRPGFTPTHGHVPDHPYVNTQRTEPRPHTNVVMGDSIGVGMGPQYPGVRNVAVSGVSIGAAANQFASVPRGSVADVYLGTNNAPYTEAQNRQQVLEFLRQADLRGVRINNWILPAHHERSPATDAGLRRVGEVITRTIQEYNAAHPDRPPIQTIATRDRGVVQSADGYHFTDRGTQQLRTLVAQHQVPQPRPAVYARAEPHPHIPLNRRWIINTT